MQPVSSARSPICKHIKVYISDYPLIRERGSDNVGIWKDICKFLLAFTASRLKVITVNQYVTAVKKYEHDRLARERTCNTKFRKETSSAYSYTHISC